MTTHGYVPVCGDFGRAAFPGVSLACLLYADDFLYFFVSFRQPRPRCA